MNPINRSLLVLGALFISASAFAGSSSGGGGNAVLCYSSVAVRNRVAAEIQDSPLPTDPVDLQLSALAAGFKPQLLDLWDARKATGFPGQMNGVEIIVRTPENIYALIDPMMKKYGELTHAFYEQGENAENFLKRTRTTAGQWKSEAGGIIRFEDATIQSRFPANCLVAQVAFYDDKSDIVHYDSRIVDLMDKVDQYALRVHEDLYHACRIRGQQWQEYVDNEISDVSSSGGTLGIDASALAKVRALIQVSKTSDAVRLAVANLFTSHLYDDATAQFLETALLEPKN